MQESELFSVFTDKETGDMYGYIEGAGGEQRFVKYDKNSENKVRQEKLNEERAKAKGLGDENDEVSEQTFSFDSNWEGYDINTFLKYRPDGRSGYLRYRIAFKAPEKILEKGQSESIKCKFSSGKEKELKADGLLATCIQHEIDHLNGKLFIDYLGPIKRSFITKKMKKYKKEISKNS